MMVGWLFLFAGLGLGVGVLGALRWRWLWLVGTLAGMAAAGLAALPPLAGGAAWDWHSEFAVGGERLHLHLDALGAFFLLLLAVLGCAGTVYAAGYCSDGHHPVTAPSGRLWWSLLLGAMGFVLVSANGLHFLIAWELFSIGAYFLVSLERQKPEARAAGWLFLTASHAGVLVLFAFFALLAAGTGSWELGPMGGRADFAPLFWLALVGFGIKAGVFPLHVWLPSAHANAPSHVSALLSGMALKVAVYGLVRFTGWLPIPVGAGWAVAGMGAASAVLGVAFALGQHDLKRLLAYHSVENIGIIFLGLGFAMLAPREAPAWGHLALAGALLHVWNHGVFKSLLFLGAGSVVRATGTRTMSRLGGLWRAMPWTASLFGLGAAAIVGLPPLNGFVSEWLLYLGLFDAAALGGACAFGAIPAAVVLGVTGALALACFVKVCGIVFLGLPRGAEALRARECGWLMRLPMVGLAAICLGIGLAPAAFWPAASAASAAWNPAWTVEAAPAPLLALGRFHLALAAAGIAAAAALSVRSRRNGIARAATWDCGFAAPTSRMQYTAGSFAGIITGWFSAVLRPRRTGGLPRILFPTEAQFAERTPETVLECIVFPAGRIVLRLSTAVRRLQHGRVQTYILYLLLGLAAVAVIAVVAGER